MANAYILFDDSVPSATLTGTSTASGLPLANMQDPQPRKVARWQATTGFVVADFGAAVPIGAVVLAGTNLSATATRRVRLSSVDTTGAAGDVHDSGTAAAGCDQRYGGSFSYTLTGNLSARYLRVDLTDTSLSFIDVGLLLAGAPFRAGRNFSYGWGLGYKDFSIAEQSPIGVTFSSSRPRARSLTLRFEYATASEAHQQLLELQRVAGVAQNIAVIPDPDGAWRAQQLVVGPLVDLTPIANSALNIFSTSISVTERI